MQPNPSLQTLLDMIAVRRPAGSKTEKRFIKTHLMPLGLQVDGCGNLYKRVGDTPQTILWSCHTDTVHKEGGVQKVLYDDETEMISLSKLEDVSNCLGADNTAGVWMLREMILAGIPGLYVFHRGEEIGGIGSSYIAKYHPNLLDGIKAAIAFDRRGTKSVITHQCWSRSASDEFGTSLARALRLRHELDDGGIFTDTANYVDHIGECTNISAGFMDEHTRRETLDVQYLFELRDAVISMDTSALVFKRKPGEHDDWMSRYRGHNSIYDQSLKRYALAVMVRDNYSAVASLLEEIGYDSQALYHELMATQGHVNTYEKSVA